MCVKTGVPTADTLTIKGRAEPGWTGAMLLFGFFAYLLARSGSSKAYEIIVPFRQDAFARYRRWRRASWTLAASGVLLACGAAFAGYPTAHLLLGLTVLGLAAALVNDLVNAVGVRLSREGTLVLTRVNPAFRDAVLAQHTTN